MGVVLASATATRQSQFRFRCSQCGEVHVGLPDVCFPTPDSIRDMPEAEFADSCLINDDICIVGGHSHFIYCILEVPVIDYPDQFGWGVWCETAWAPFKRYWESTGNSNQAPQKSTRGMLANDLEHMDSTCGLRCELKFREDGLRPLVVLPPSDHELYRIQQEGLSVEQAVAQAQSVGTLLLVT